MFIELHLNGVRETGFVESRKRDVQRKIGRRALRCEGHIV